MPLRGASANQDLQDKIFVDPRSVFERFDEIAESNPELVPFAVGVMALIGFFVPILTLPLCLASFALYKMASPTASLPLFMPQQDPFARFQKKGQKLDGERDPRDRVSDNAPAPYARGIFYLGYLQGKRKSQCWITDSALRQHHVLFGTSGAGKTEALLGFAFNSLCWGSGLAFFDGKGTPEFFYKMYATASQFGRQEDVLLLNWMTSNQDLTIKTPERVSNTTAIYTIGSGPFLTELTASLMPESGSDGMWKDRAIALVSALNYVLTFDRDNYNKPFSPSSLRQNLSIAKIVEHSKRRDLPPVPKAAVEAYLRSLPGFVPSKGAAQEAKTLEQHGFLEMQFTKIMATLSDTYGHIFDRLLGEVSMIDVVLNNRILVLLLPSLEKSGHESRGLGVLGMTLMRAMMAQMMGFKVEGSAYQNVEALPTRATFPYVITYDEIGYYMPKDGTAIQAAQARSLGLSVVIAGQDRTKLDEQSSTETNAIIGTTRWKHAMSVENKPTFDVFAEQAGQADVAVKSGYTRQRGTFDDTYRTDDSVRFDRRDRMSISDIRGMRAGQGMTLYEKDVHKINYFYADVPHAGLTNVVINQFLEISPPSLDDLLKDTEEWHAELERLRLGLRKLVDATVEADQLMLSIREHARIAAMASSQPHEQAATSLGLMLLRRAARRTEQDSARIENLPPVDQGTVDVIEAPPVLDDESQLDVVATEVERSNPLRSHDEVILNNIDAMPVDGNLDESIFRALSGGFEAPMVSVNDSPNAALAKTVDAGLPSSGPKTNDPPSNLPVQKPNHLQQLSNALREVAEHREVGTAEAMLLSISEQAIAVSATEYQPQVPSDIPDIAELESIIAGLRTVNN